MKKFKFLLVLGVFSMATACTDLALEADDSIIEESEDGTYIGDAGANLTTAYNDLNAISDQANIYALTEHVTDEMIPPTRGTDWGDNGVWRTLHAHTWDATHSMVTDSWDQLNGRAFKCSQVLASIAPAPTKEQAAEAKFLRAFYTYQVMDLFGQVPFREIGSVGKPKIFTRAEAFDFVVKDLTEAKVDLPALAPKVGGNTQASKAAASALLARLFLNKAVYTSGVENAAGPYTFAAADMDEVIKNCDEVAAAGYSLDPDFFNNFKEGASNELIFECNSNGGSPENRLRMTLHYDQNPGGWNGFTTLSDFYAKFTDNNDQRKGKAALADGTDFSGTGYGFLVGPQVDDKGVKLTNSRTGTQLDYTADVPLSGANTGAGIRVIKYHKGVYGKYLLLRMGDVVLMKAEAQMRKGSNVDALATVNALRAVRSAGPIGTLDEAAMLNERGFEMYWEGIRRTDQIRFGTFTGTWQDKLVTDRTRVLFPIPQRALDSNPLLLQNAGY